MACRRAGSATRSKSNGMLFMSVSSIRETYQLLREHLRQFPGNYRINEEDRSNKTPLTTVQLLARAAKAGTHIGQLCQAIYRNEAELGIRRILGVVALAKNTVWPPSTMPAPRPSIWEWRTTDSCAAIWNATPSSRCVMSIP